MRKYFKAANGKNGQEIFAQRFAQELGKQTVDRLFESFWNEKRTILKKSFSRSVKYILSLGVLFSTSGYLFNFLVENNRFGREQKLSDQETLIVFGMLSTLALSTIFVLTNFSWESRHQDPELKRWEHIIPNLQIPSLVAGNTSLLLNSGKLITLKKE